MHKSCGPFVEGSGSGGGLLPNAPEAACACACATRGLKPRAFGLVKQLADLKAAAEAWLSGPCFGDVAVGHGIRGP